MTLLRLKQLRYSYITVCRAANGRFGRFKAMRVRDIKSMRKYDGPALKTDEGRLTPTHVVVDSEGDEYVAYLP